MKFNNLWIHLNPRNFNSLWIHFSPNFFQVLLSTIFRRGSAIFNKTFLASISLTCNIFPKDGFFAAINFNFKKVVDSLLLLHYQKANKNSETSRLMVGTSYPFPLWSFSKCLVIVCVSVCVLFIYTISITIICVLQKELGLAASNQQIYDFYKWVIFEKKNTLLKVNFWYQINLFTIIQIPTVRKWQCQSIQPWVYCVFLCVCACVISNQSTSRKTRVSNLSKFGALLHKHTDSLLVLKHQGSICIYP